MYYKIIHGFNPEDYIEIEPSEVQKAFYCFLEKKDSVFSGGAIRGSQIMEIKPDFHRAMGWNRGYKLNSEDFGELSEKGIDRKAQTFLARSKEVVEHLLKTGQPELIGKAELQIGNSPRVGGEGMKHIGEIKHD